MWATVKAVVVVAAVGVVEVGVPNVDVLDRERALDAGGGEGELTQ